MKTMEIPESKEIVITSKDRVVCNGTEYEMPQYNHKEADTRISINLQDSLQREGNAIVICTIDSNIIVLVMLYESKIQMLIFGGLWCKHFCYYHINTISANLGFEKSWALPPFLWQE